MTLLIGTNKEEEKYKSKIEQIMKREYKGKIGI